VIDLNIGRVWFLSRLAAQPMLEQGKGAIVNISSGSAFFAFPIGAPYSASKAAVNTPTLSMTAARTPNGVRVNSVASGAVAPASARDRPCRSTGAQRVTILSTDFQARCDNNEC
jgi:NAD(P)-dependent dehydrogenase (short-subunit alcohol dehydrogenase family)